MNNYDKMYKYMYKKMRTHNVQSNSKIAKETKLGYQC
jgi:hypothetical protein